MLLVMSTEQVRKLMPSEKLEDLLRLITSGIAERAKIGCYSQTVGCPEGIYSEELIAQAKEEHKMRVGEGYVCPIPKGVQPRSIAPKK